MTDLASGRTSTGSIVYWVSTAVVTAELAVGGMWDVLRVSQVREVVERLGYPSYFLVILGVWKLLGAVTLLSPRLPRLKEWAYAGVVFVDTGAIVSHLWTGYGEREVVILALLLALTVASWGLRPPARRLPRRR
ncbi:DoxX family protein [Actinomadura scrupuli]|uniref:DoxX family protein n=1 Tax=Actinomadura scrupuli TaxID=559629 RepID=UPI003D962CF2